MRAVRSAVAALAGIPLFGSGAYSAVQNLNRTNLWQVTAYVNDIDGTKHAVWGRFARVVGPETRIVIAHSLGTVVAYEAIRHLGTELDLLLTTGSPLGLARVIYPKLVPDAAYPDTVGRWVNVADPDDFVAAEPRLARLFTDANGAERIEDVEVHNRGRFAWHRISAYLSHDDVRRVVWGALDA